MVRLYDVLLKNELLARSAPCFQHKNYLKPLQDKREQLSFLMILRRPHRPH